MAVAALAVLYCNRSLCLFLSKKYVASLMDAQRAARHGHPWAVTSFTGLHAPRVYMENHE